MAKLIASIHTSAGDFKVEFYPDQVPRTVSNFYNLAEDGYYDTLIFHRVIEGFMLQAGCPDGKGTGGPGYNFKDEFVPELKHSESGILSMANSDPNTNGSQFFVTLAPAPHLDGKHTVFGKVIGGLDVVMKMGSVKTDGSDRPVEDIIINSIVFESKYSPVDIGKV